MEAIVRRDTRAWRMQVWISFALALLVCSGGLAALPGAELDRAFMVMGYAFCLTSAFALAKFVRDAEGGPKDTPLWRLVVWGSFALAMALTGWGLWRMEINPTWKAYLLVSWLYLISCAFTLAKTLRDAWEADRAEARLRAAGEPEPHGTAHAARATHHTPHRDHDFARALRRRAPPEENIMKLEQRERRKALSLLLAVPLALACGAARAHGGPSEASAVSALSLALPVASVVAAPVMILAAGAVLTVTAVEASAHGTLWILERASDGARASLELSAEALGASLVAVGTVITVTALSAGWILSAAGAALCFVPNALGQSLLYSERITP